MAKKGRTPEIEVFIGTKIKEARLTRGLSQEKLAEYLGITFQQVQKYEKGSNRVSVSTLREIAGFLGVPIIDLIPASDVETAGIPKVDPAVSDMALKLALRLSRLEPRVSRALFSLVSSMAKSEEPAES